MPPLVTLTTDFGTQDPYVASMKGALHTGCPGVIVEDLSHAITPHDVFEGALFLAGAVPYFPPGSIHVVVVDPGVGTERRPVVAEAGGRVFVCPDNGLLTLYLREYPLHDAHIISNPHFMREDVSHTFHGRDVFAPAAARLAAGEALAQAGPAIDTLITLHVPEVETAEDGTIRGEVIHIDRFGNAVTNITESRLQPATAYSAEAPGLAIEGIARTYGNVAKREALALIGSTHRLEIAVREGRASELLGLARGVPIILHPQ